MLTRNRNQRNRQAQPGRDEEYLADVEEILKKELFEVCGRRPTDFGIVYESFDYADYFQEIVEMTIRPTRYFDEDCAEALGIREEVEELFDRVGWKNFLRIRKTTYERLVIEFFSTNKEVYGVDRDVLGVNFRLGNLDRYLSVDDLNAIFETRRVTRENSGPRGLRYNEAEFWR